MPSAQVTTLRPTPHSHLTLPLSCPLQSVLCTAARAFLQQSYCESSSDFFTLRMKCQLPLSPPRPAPSCPPLPTPFPLLPLSRLMGLLATHIVLSSLPLSQAFRTRCSFCCSFLPHPCWAPPPNLQLSAWMPPLNLAIIESNPPHTATVLLLYCLFSL